MKQGMGVGLAFTADENQCNIPTKLGMHMVCCPFKPTMIEGTDCVCVCVCAHESATAVCLLCVYMCVRARQKQVQVRQLGAAALQLALSVCIQPLCLSPMILSLLMDYPS